MKKIDWIIAILMIIGVAVFFYRLGKRDQQYDMLSAQVADQDTRITEIEGALAKHETRWHFLNSTVDWVRAKLPW